MRIAGHAVRASPIIVRVHTPRLLLRMWRVADAQALSHALLIDGGAHVRRWLFSAKNEPQPIDARIAKIRDWRRRTLAGKDLMFAALSRDETEVVGSVSMHMRIGFAAGEIGYWVRADRVRQGFAREMAGAIARIGFDALGLRRMEIHTDPENLASVGVARTLGFDHHATIPGCVLSADSPVRNDTIWAMPRAKYAGSVAAAMPVTALDRRGQPALRHRATS